jgi:DNA repair and recombination protein RAD52
MPFDDKTINDLQGGLDPPRVKQREGPSGRSLSYLAAHDVIRKANEVFGFGGWGYVVRQLAEFGTEKGKTAKGKDFVRVGYRCIVELTVADRPPVSGVGYGEDISYTGTSVQQHELAVKEAESDALKRAFRNYGDQFGLSLYDDGTPSAAFSFDSRSRTLT